MADRVGQQLGNYRLVQLLGRGGFAEVYLGEHLHLKTRAAIKVLHTQLAGNEVASFQKEAQTIRNVRKLHPGFYEPLCRVAMVIVEESSREYSFALLVAQNPDRVSVSVQQLVQQSQRQPMKTDESR